MRIHTTFVIDRSGSMSSCASDAEGGLNKFVEEQRKFNDSDTFTLIQFDTEYEIVYNAVPFRNVSKYKFVPRGSTALLDALGRAINETGDYLRKLPESERAEKVIFIVFTDGFENASHEFTKVKVNEMIKHQTEKYKWEFVYMGANQDAFAEAGSLGINVSNAVNYSSSPVGTSNAFRMVSKNTLNVRSAGGIVSDSGYFEGIQSVDDSTQQ